MTQTNENRSPRLAARQRVAVVMVGCGLAGLLLVARSLTPAAQGYGTHEQLGLAPCTLLTVTGHRCPACGMTTSWSHLVRGRVLEAFAANAAGALLGIFAIAAVAWCWLTAWVGRPMAVRSVQPKLALLAAVFVLVSLVHWGIRLLD